MALTTRLEFRQSQALVMTPQLMQAIKLLQLSNLDLMAYVEEELEKNPLLERASDVDGPNVAAEVVEKCKELRVFYDQDDPKSAAKTNSKSSPKAGTMKAAQPGPGGRQSIRRLEARGGVIVTTKDQTATGETGIFEMKTNTVTLSGGVVITQGANVLKGDRLVVDLTTNFAKVEGGRVQGLFSTSKDDKPGGKDDKAAQDKNPFARKKPTALPAATN